MTFIHDSLLTGYTVDGTNRTIVLHTQPHQGGGTVPIDVIFSGVVAYHFEGDCFCNTVFDIEEVPSARIIGDGKAFAERGRLYGWPRDWDSGREAPEEFFSRVQCRCFELSCSYGMYWVGRCRRNGANRARLSRSDGRCTRRPVGAIMDGRG